MVADAVWPLGGQLLIIGDRAGPGRVDTLYRDECKQRVKTVYINGKFTAQRTTGVQRVAAALLAALDECLHSDADRSDTRWVLLCPPSGLKPTLRHVEVREVGVLWIGLQMWEQLVLPMASRKGVLLNLSGSAPALRSRQVCMFHDAAVFDHPEAYRPVFAAWYRFLFKRLSQRALLVVTVSEFSKRRLMHHLGLPDDRIAIVRSGAEHLSQVEPDFSVAVRLGLRPGRFFIAVGSSNPTKNHVAAIRAFRALQAGEDVRFVIVGGTHDAVFAAGAQSHADDRVVHTGMVTDAQVKGLYQQAAGLVFPSIYEGYGLPPLEAMSCGCPVIASNAAAIPEVCADAAIYVDPTSVSAITEAMERVLGEPLLRERLRRLGARRTSELTWPAAARSLLAHLAPVGVIGPPPMKVLQLCKFYPPVSGGMESVVYELTEGLVRRGISVDVLCANLQMRTRTERADGGYFVTRAASWGRVLSTSMSPALVSCAKHMCKQADLVHVHMPDPMTALALWLARPRGKLVVHWHSDVVRQRLAMQIYRPLQDWLLRRADAIIATSNAYAASSPWLRQWRHKTAVIPIGISDPPGGVEDAAADRIRERFGARHIVFSLGRMTYYKGFDVLIDAATSLDDRCVIIVGGEGELLGRYRDQVVRRGLTQKICFVGHIPQQDLAAYFSAASVFCLASTQRAEAFGVVLLEAMAMGKPVVATDIPGSAVPWVNQSGVTGLNVPAGDAKAMAEAINRITGDADYAKRLGQAARARFVQCLHVDTMVQRTVDLYRQVGIGGGVAPGSSALHRPGSGNGPDTGTSP